MRRQGTVETKVVKVVAALLGAAVLAGVFTPGAAVALAAPAAPGTPGGAPGASAGGVLDEALMGPAVDGEVMPAAERPQCLPPLTEEQERLLDRARALVAELGRILDEAAIYSARESWAQVEIELLDYVSTLATLEQVVDAFVATVPEGRPFPFRHYLGPILGDIPAQAADLAAVWAELPEANRVAVRRAVEAAAEASDHPRFWRGLVRLVRSELPHDPGAIRERLEAMLERAERSLELTLDRMAKLEQRIAELEERIASCEDEVRRELLKDLKHLAELDLAVCKARVARDRFAIEMVQERLEELGDEQ